MKNGKPIERILQLLFYLNYPFGRTLNDCKSAIFISKSTFYEYLKTLQDLGFFISNIGGKYYLDTTKSSNEWFTKLFHINEEDAYLLSKAIDGLDIAVPKANILKQNLLKVFDRELFAYQLAKQSENSVTKKLIHAIQKHKQVLLVNYYSGNSQTISNRLVEPFKISDSFNMVWCYDVEKQSNRQFKISRISAIKETSFDWEYKPLHKSMPTDIFRNTGELKYTIEIKLNIRSYNLLVEEYPLAERCLKKTGNDTFLLKCKVAKMEGPARFVLGLWDNIQVKGDQEFKNFIYKKIKLFA